MRPHQKKYEEYAYVLDYLPHGSVLPGRPSFKSGPIVQLIGETYFTLLEARAKEGASFSPQERVYVGKDHRDKIANITGRLRYEDLTATAKSELRAVVEKIVRENEERFVKFFNEAELLTPRLHALELIPGIGRKFMGIIIEEREKKPFTSFEDLQNRTKIPDPVKLLVKRIIDELSGDEKYHLFTRPK